MLYDGIGMVAKAIGAYTINVRGRGVQPRRGKLLAETLSTRVYDAQALILNRTTSTLRVPSRKVRCSTHSCSAAPFENGTMGRSGKMGRLLREMGRLCSEARRQTTNDRMKSAGTALDSYNIYLSGSVPAVFQR